jgi:hypothetical protein
MINDWLKNTARKVLRQGHQGDRKPDPTQP